MGDFFDLIKCLFEMSVSGHLDKYRDSSTFSRLHTCSCMFHVFYRLLCNYNTGVSHPSKKARVDTIEKGERICKDIN